MSYLEHSRHAKQAELVTWLIGPARRDCSPEAIVGGLSERLVAAGVALKRVRIGQRLSNPMIGVWGVIWTRGEGAVLYTRPRTTFSTPFYYGSPFQEVIEQRRSVRHSLEHLGPDAIASMSSSPRRGIPTTWRCRSNMETAPRKAAPSRPTGRADSRWPRSP